MDNDKSRKAFERHLITCFGFSLPAIMIYRTEDDYIHTEMDEHWKTWKAAINFKTDKGVIHE